MSHEIYQVYPPYLPYETVHHVATTANVSAAKPVEVIDCSYTILILIVVIILLLIILGIMIYFIFGSSGTITDDINRTTDIVEDMLSLVRCMATGFNHMFSVVCGTIVQVLVPTFCSVRHPACIIVP